MEEFKDHGGGGDYTNFSFFLKKISKKEEKGKEKKNLRLPLSNVFEKSYYEAKFGDC